MDNFDQFGQAESSALAPVPAPPALKLEAFSSSAELKDLFCALAKAQGEMKPAILDMKNPHFNSTYASLTSCKESYQGPLAKHGLGLTQDVFSMGSRYFIRTLMFHSSGQWRSSVFELIIDKKNMQGLGTAITYARRYGANAMVGVVDTEDDDGNASSGSKPKTQVAPPATGGGTSTPKSSPPQAAPQGTKPIAPKGQEQAQAAASPAPPAPDMTPPTEKQLARLFTIATTGPGAWTKEQLKEYIGLAWKIDSTKKLTRAQYDHLVGLVETLPFSQACARILSAPKA
jgi:hypothetical protein